MKVRLLWRGPGVEKKSVARGSCCGLPRRVPLTFPGMNPGRSRAVVPSTVSLLPAECRAATEKRGELANEVQFLGGNAKRQSRGLAATPA